MRAITSYTKLYSKSPVLWIVFGIGDCFPLRHYAPWVRGNLSTHIKYEMINYKNITNFKRKPEELTEFLMWCTVTPGKRSDVITPKFNSMFEDQTPTKLMRSHKKNMQASLEKAGIGQYDRITKCWNQIKLLLKQQNLRDVTREELINIEGIGPKTASFFIAHSQAWSEVAVLDVHILKYLKQMFPSYLVPEQTPQNLEEYQRLEWMFLGIAASKHMSPAELDTEIWQSNALSQ